MHARSEKRPETAVEKLPYRADIDGLRALAVVAVIMFHAGLVVAPGGYVGVDIFFVISGYLISSLLFAELDRTGSIDFVRFWARRTRRLLPSAVLVVTVTLAVSWFVLSDLYMFYAGRDAIFALTYTTNWQKLTSAISYFDDGSGAGPFLHYWSLAVEEQFYLFLTIVFALALYLGGRGGRTPAEVTIVVLIMAGVASLAANVVLTADAQPLAFFGTHARIWQLCLGAGVGLAERSGWLPGLVVRRAAAWAGLAMMAASILLLSEQLAYPGLYAVLPSLGAASFILAGIDGHRGKGDRRGIDRPRPLAAFGTALPVSVGKLSYALYLWHWPAFELYKAAIESWETVDKILAIAITAGLATASYHIVENPIRFNARLASRPRGSLAAAICVTILVGAGAYAVQSTKSGNLIILANGDALAPRAVQRDRPRIYKEKCHVGPRDVDYPPCIFGRKDSDAKIFLVGDSHAAHWFSMVDAFARRHGYALYNRTKSACIGVDVVVRSSILKREYVECAAWRKAVMEEIARERPFAVIFGNSSAHLPFVSGTGHVRGERGHRGLAEGEAKTIQALLAKDIKVILMKDMPWVPGDPIDCLVANPRNAEICRWKTDVSFRERRSPWSIDFRRWGDEVKIVDLSHRSCRSGYCYAASDELVKMRDSHHITSTYAATLVDDFEREMSNFLDLRRQLADGS